MKKSNRYKIEQNKNIYIIGTACHKKQTTWNNRSKNDTVHLNNGIPSHSTGSFNRE